MEARVQPLPPPVERVRAFVWLHRNLFDGWGNTLLTLATGAGLVAALRGVIRWAIHAHWAVVTENLRFWMVGLLPFQHVWRAWWAGGLVGTAAVLTVVGARAGVSSRIHIGLWTGTLIAVVWLFSPVRIDQIGGLYLTLLLALVAISLSFPIGVLVGVGRVSPLPVIRLFCTAYIECIRGIPLIAMLLWFSIFVTLVSGDALSRVQRAMIAMTIFSSAYVAETMRGGILSVPRGQTEAARALGLSGWQTMAYIVLPQAFKNMIPALVGQFIGLFKDTSLAVIIGLSELIGIGKALLAIPQYLHDVREVYVFALLVFFVFSYTMSYASRLLERKLGLGER